MFQKSELDAIIEALTLLEEQNQSKLESARTMLTKFQKEAKECQGSDQAMNLQGQIAEISGKIVEIEDDIDFNRSVIRTTMMTRDLPNISELSPEDAFKAGWQFAEKYFDKEK